LDLAERIDAFIQFLKGTKVKYFAFDKELELLSKIKKFLFDMKFKIQYTIKDTPEKEIINCSTYLV